MYKYISKIIRDAFHVVELEVKEVPLQDDPALAWTLRDGACLYEVVAPPSLKGERYFSYFLFDHIIDCIEDTEKQIEFDAYRTASKRHAEVNLEEVQEKKVGIKISYLEFKMEKYQPKERKAHKAGNMLMGDD
jgi:hypothetical protein